MKSRAILTILVPGVMLILMSATVWKSSSGAPASHTGAPGENTCGVAGCHDDNALNSGTAQLDMELGTQERLIIPGKKYSIKVKIADAMVNRFGFQIIALENKTDKPIGAFTISDSLRTQIVSNAYKLKERQYVTYTFDGTDAISEGNGEWSLDWTAPEKLTQPVTFYLAGVSANDDMSDKGDHVFTKSFTFNQSALK
jgi:hypothetical protein